MRFELALFLVLLAFAVAFAHMVLTCRDRGNITAVTVLVALGRAAMLLRKLLPAR